MAKYPYVPVDPTIKPHETGGWTDKMRRCRDDGEHKRVIYAPDLLGIFCAGMTVEHVADTVQARLRAATVADVYIRRLPCRGNGNGVHALVIRRTPEGTAIYFRTCRGGGMDLLAHVMQGIPLWLPPGYEVTKGKDGKPDGWRASDSTRPPVILTDHCGLDIVAHPFGEGFRSLTLDSTELTRLGYIVL